MLMSWLFQYPYNEYVKEDQAAKLLEKYPFQYPYNEYVKIKLGCDKIHHTKISIPV